MRKITAFGDHELNACLFFKIFPPKILRKKLPQISSIFRVNLSIYVCMYVWCLKSDIIVHEYGEISMSKVYPN